MFGDDDPEIAPFFAKFLGEGPRRASPAPAPTRTRRDRRAREQPLAGAADGLAVGLSGAAAILSQGSAPRGARLRAERTEAFHQMLEDMANDIMENGPPETPARSVSPVGRTSADESDVEQPRDLPAASGSSDDESEEEQSIRPLATSQDCMPDEFEELTTDGWTYPHRFQVVDNQVTDPAWPTKSRPTRPERKVAHSPPPPAHAALGASSKLNDLSFAPTPSRHWATSSFGLPGQSRALQKS